MSGPHDSSSTVDLATNPLIASEDETLSEALCRARLHERLFGRSSPEVLLGRFVLRRELGRGGHGVVYDAFDPETHQPVAVKLLQRMNPRELERFKQEFRSLRAIVHPNVVELQELCTDGHRWFISMELIEGRDLLSHIHHLPSTVRYAEIRGCFTQLVEGVRAVHRDCKLHRDLKPSNVLVHDHDSRVTILDFGLVGETGENGTARDSLQAGTPGYMAPERLRGHAATEASDWYAIGVMLFEALTRSRPEADPATNRTRLGAELALWPELAPEERKRLAAVTLSLLDDAPERRPGPDDVLQALGLECGLVCIDRAGAPPTVTLMGRDGELDLLRAAYRAAGNAGPRTLFVVGGTGMGKTALLEAFAKSLPHEAVRLEGRCNDCESVPFNVVDILVDALVNHLRGLPQRDVRGILPPHVGSVTRMFPAFNEFLAYAPHEDVPPDAREVRRRAVESLRAVLRRIAATRPTIVLLDDIHWGDRDSASFLAELLNPPDAPPLLLLGGASMDRGKEADFITSIGSYLGAPVECIPLAPLDASTREDLAQSALSCNGVRSPPLARAIAGASGGVPLVIVELAFDCARASGMGSDPEAWLARARASRVSALDAASMEALELLALSNRPTLETVIDRALNRPTNDAGASWSRTLRRARLVRRRRGKRVELLPTARDIVRAPANRADHAARHERLAVAYATCPDPDPQVLADHWEAAGNRARAYHYAVAAAEVATSKLAFNRSAELFDRALRLLPPGDARRATVGRSLGDALATAGRSAEAADAYREAASRSAATDRPTLDRLVVTHLLRSGQETEALLLADRMLAEVGLAVPRSRLRTLVELQLTRPLLRIRGYDFTPRDVASIPQHELNRLDLLDRLFREIVVLYPERGALLLVWFLRDALRVGEVRRLQQGFAWAAFNTAWVGGSRAVKRVDDLLRRADSLGPVAKDPYAQATSRLVWSARHLFTGHHRRARDLAQEAEGLFRSECAGAVWEENVAVTVRLAAAEFAGPLADIEHESEVREQAARERSDQFARNLLVLSRGFAHLMRDAPEAAMALCERHERAQSGPFDTNAYWVMTRKADVLLYRADGLATVEHYDRHWRAYSRSVQFTAPMMRMATLNRRARGYLHAFRTTRDPAYRRRAERDISVLDSQRRPDSRLWVELLRAGIDQHLGETASARQRLSAALAFARSAELEVHSLYLEHQLARLLDRQDGGHRSADVQSKLRAQGVRAPERWFRMMCPLD